jgi:hypothetical protein
MGKPPRCVRRLEPRHLARVLLPRNGLPFGITGPSLYAHYAVDVQIADASDVAFVMGGLPAGGPYTIGVQVPPGVTCDGSSPFSIVACTTIDVTLDVTCSEPPEAGGDDADGDDAIAETGASDMRGDGAADAATDRGPADASAQ